MAAAGVEEQQEAGFGPSALLTPANGITVARLVAGPVAFAIVLARGPSWVAFVLWIALAATDGLDGWTARRHGTTRSGAFLDPLADKFVLLCVLAALALGGWVWWLPVALIGSREVAMSLYRARGGRRGVSLPARRSAKAKTVVQDIAVGAALAPAIVDSAPAAVSALLWAAVVITLVTGGQYLWDLRHGWPLERASLRRSELGGGHAISGGTEADMSPERGGPSAGRVEG